MAALCKQITSKTHAADDQCHVTLHMLWIHRPSKLGMVASKGPVTNRLLPTTAIGQEIYASKRWRVGKRPLAATVERWNLMESLTPQYLE
jgi:hypothetical protein